jgi:hypothetical protein
MTPADHVRCRARKDEIDSRKPGSWGEPGLFALGEFTIQKKGIPAYNVKEGFLYTCGKGKTDQATNISNVVGIHRIALMIPA